MKSSARFFHDANLTKPHRPCGACGDGQRAFALARPLGFYADSMTFLDRSFITQSEDTFAEYRRMTPAERLRLTFDLIEEGWPYLNIGTE